MSPRARAWLEMHVCVLLWGFTGILGKLITLDALPLVWWRVVLVTAALLFVRSFWVGVSRLSARSAATLAGNGVVLALHWRPPTWDGSSPWRSPARCCPSRYRSWRCAS